MKQLNIPDAPNVDSPMYRGNPLAWSRAMTAWAQNVKGVIQNAHNEAVKPCGQQFIAADYTTNTEASGTYVSVTDVANVLASLVDTLTQKGVLSPTVSRTQTQ